MDPIIWSILLLFVGLTLISAEVFIPSGGLLGFLSVAALVASIFTAFFYRGPEIGLVFLLVTVLSVPVSLTLAFRYWPQTPMGRRLLLRVPTSEEVLPDSPQRQRLRQLVGKFGVTRSVMMPSGAVLVDGQVIDALTDGLSLEIGQPIQVIEVRGTHVLVRPVSDQDRQQASTVAEDDVLSQPIESLGLESFDDPLA